MPIALHARTVTEALDRADQRHWTRRPPRADRARLNYLIRLGPGGVQELATRLRAAPDVLARLAAGDGPPADDLLSRELEREVLHRWQPRIRRRAHEAILDNQGQMSVSFRARFGFTAARGSTDDPRLRFLTLRLHEPYPEQLFTAHHRRAPETELHQILGHALAASYFRHGGTKTAQEVTLNEIDFLEFYY